VYIHDVQTVDHRDLGAPISYAQIHPSAGCWLSSPPCIGDEHCLTQSRKQALIQRVQPRKRPAFPSPKTIRRFVSPIIETTPTNKITVNKAKGRVISPTQPSSFSKQPANRSGPLSHTMASKTPTQAHLSDPALLSHQQPPRLSTPFPFKSRPPPSSFSTGLDYSSKPKVTWKKVVFTS
jgi:hypothetical protein